MDEISEILALVETRVGLNFEGTRLTTARSTVLEHAIDYASLAEFRAALLRTPLCWQTLIDRLVVNETFFFRHPEQLAIAADAVGERAQRGEDTRIASIGCSSGEEPYSLAILLRERELLDGATLTGFDVSATMLRRAAEGRYSPWALRTTSVSRRASYFSEHSDRSFELDPSIREQVRFRHLNLLEPTDTEPFDILLCCNILYYFRDSALTNAVEALKQLTRPSGLLIVGPS
ncbi:MAG: CheR family methyltransferase, partial [Myxococcota bacterium]